MLALYYSYPESNRTFVQSFYESGSRRLWDTQSRRLSQDPRIGNKSSWWKNSKCFLWRKWKRQSKFFAVYASLGSF